MGVGESPAAQVCAAPAGSTNNAMVWAVAAIAWLESAVGQAASQAEIGWRFATARIRLHAAHTRPQLHLALGHQASTMPRWSSRAGPPPRTNLRLLEQHMQAGGDPSLALDGVFAARTTAAHADATHDTYSSHMNMIGWACKNHQGGPDASTIAHHSERDWRCKRPEHPERMACSLEACARYHWA